MREGKRKGIGENGNINQKVKNENVRRDGRKKKQMSISNRSK